jgi:hypothetical protein
MARARAKTALEKVSCIPETSSIISENCGKCMRRSPTISTEGRRSQEFLVPTKIGSKLTVIAHFRVQGRVARSIPEMLVSYFHNELLASHIFLNT